MRLADWSVLKNRNVVIWPDNDAPGYSAAITLQEILKKQNNKIKIIEPHAQAPKGWDVADFIEQGAKLATIQKYIKEHLVSVHDFRLRHDDDYGLSNNSEPPEYPAPPEENEQEQEPPAENETPVSRVMTGSEPFRVLGHDRDRYYYLSRDKGQIVSIKTAAHNKANLLSIAPYAYWCDNFWGEKSVNWTVVQDTLMRQADKQGLFSVKKIRGRGAWRDEDDIVVHVGDRLLVNGVSVDPVLFKSYYIYERGMKVLHSNEDIATKKEGKEIIELFKLFAWKSNVHAILAAGWAFLAPIGGALKWRPHIWISGEAGSGKSWIRDNIIAPFVRDFGLITQGSTTAAGIRQALGTDALPVLFDEAESSDRKAVERMTEIIEFIRQSSLNSESPIIKGSATGESVIYAPASMWCLSSIVTSIKQQADQDRISILELLSYTPEVAKIKGRSLEEQHRVTADKAARLLTKQAGVRLRNRAFSRIKTILKNIDVFVEAAAFYFKNKRMGDQVGTLLAGAYCLCSDGLINKNKALDYIQSQDWSEIIIQEDREKDYEQLLRNIMQHNVLLNAPHAGILRRSIAQIIEFICDVMYNQQQDILYAKDFLSGLGIHVDENSETISIEKKHIEIQKILKETQWSQGYARTLSRSPFAIDNKKTITFSKKDLSFFEKIKHNINESAELEFDY